MGLQGAVGGTERLHVVFLLCRQGGKAAASGRLSIAVVRTLP